MILWINGAFGSGKTTVSYALHRRLPDSFVYDPENIGFFLRKNMPPVCDREDFQDIPLWRAWNYQLLKSIAETYSGTVIVPMTLVTQQYYEEILLRLQQENITCRHFILSARRETILKRLKKRSFGLIHREAFAVQAIDRCLDFFDRQTDAVKIETDSMTVDEIVSAIASQSRLKLLPDHRTRLGKMLDRWKVAVQHIRI